MAKDDFSVKLISRDDGSERPLNVVEVIEESFMSRFGKFAMYL